MGGKFDPEYFGAERNVVAYTSTPSLRELDRLRRRWRVNKPVAFLHDDRFRIDHPLFSAKTNRRFEKFIWVETYGSPDIHRVRVTV